jgi:hypothetical protein
MDQNVKIERTIRSIFYSPDWKRLKQYIADAPHDVEREMLVKIIRLQLISNLTEFRKAVQK